MKRQGLGKRGWGSGTKGSGFGIGGWGFGTLLGLAFLLVGNGTAFAAAPATDTPARLTVNVRNYAKIDHKTLVRAGEVAHRILHGAGIEATFVPLAPDEKYQEGSTPGSLNFSIKVLSREMATKLDLPTTNMGLTPGEEHERTEAFVFAHVATGLAQRQSYASLAEILGHAMAHEIGHLFNLRHSPQGIMHGDWDERDLANMGKGMLNFNREQAAQIRAEMTRRTNLAQKMEMAALINSVQK